MKKAVASKKVVEIKKPMKNQVVNKNIISKNDLDRKFERLSTIPQPTIELPPKIETAIQLSYNFEAFTQATYPGGRKSKNSSITIYKNGIFSINSVFVRELEKLGDFTHAKLFYDKNSTSIGISFKSHANEGCLRKISKTKVGLDKRFSSKSFFIYYDLDLNKISGKYTPKMEYINKEIGDIFVLDLKK